VGPLAALGLHRDEIDALVRAGASVEDAWYLVRAIGCPPALAAEILLWASEIDGAAESGEAP
jgi:hypothetical protein